MAISRQAHAKVIAESVGDPKRYRMDLENDDVRVPRIKLDRATYAIRLAGLLLALASAITARADDQQLVTRTFLDNLNVHGDVIRRLPDDLRWSNFPKFQLLRRDFPAIPSRATSVPSSKGLECSDIFFVQNEEVGFFAPNTRGAEDLLLSEALSGSE